MSEVIPDTQALEDIAMHCVKNSPRFKCNIPAIPHRLGIDPQLWYNSPTVYDMKSLIPQINWSKL